MREAKNSLNESVEVSSKAFGYNLKKLTIRINCFHRSTCQIYNTNFLMCIGEIR